MSDKLNVDTLIGEHYERYLEGIMKRGGVDREQAMEILHTLYTQYWEDNLVDHGGNRVVFDQYVWIKRRG